MEEPKEKPVLLDAIGKLCNEGKDVANYLFQVPDDEAQRERLRKILEQIKADKSMSKRKEMPQLIEEMQGLLSQPPDMMAAEQLQAGFDRIFKLWAAARSGLF